GRYNREFVERWWNWREDLTRERPELEPGFASFEKAFFELYRGFTLGVAAAEAGVPASTLRAIPGLVAAAGAAASLPPPGRRRRATWVAGRCRAPSLCSTP